MAFSLAKLRLPKAPARHRRTPGAHRDAPGRPHPRAVPGGAVRGVNQRASEDEKYRGEHRAGKHSRPRTREQARPRDPYESYDRLAPLARRPERDSEPRSRRAMGQPPRTQTGHARSRFGSMPKMTDLAAEYRRAGTPAISPAESRRAEQRAAEWRRVGEARRRRELVERVEQHEAPPRRRGQKPPAPAQRAPEPPRKATGRAARPANELPSERGREAGAEQRYRAAKKAGNTVPAHRGWPPPQDPGRHSPKGRHPYFGDAT